MTVKRSKETRAALGYGNAKPSEFELHSIILCACMRMKGMIDVAWLILLLLYRVEPSISKWSNQSAICI